MCSPSGTTFSGLLSMGAWKLFNVGAHHVDKHLGAAAPAAAAATIALPAGWYATMDETTGKEYYYDSEAAVNWEWPQ